LVNDFLSLFGCAADFASLVTDTKLELAGFFHEHAGGLDGDISIRSYHKG
jgi:hypothetical protein